MAVLDDLKQWQARRARQEGVESYRILPYKTLVELSEVLPHTELELLNVKGIGAVKVRRYGKELLALIHEDKSVKESSPQPTEQRGKKKVAGDSVTGEIVPKGGDDIFSVSDFLSALNVLMSSHFGGVRVRGEIVDFRRNANGHAYFQIKDASGVMRVTVFRGAYEISGADLSDGIEVVVTGYPQHHAQYGFSFIGETIELAGEGALKKAYDVLKKKLTAEGLFANKNKRALPLFPQNIGLITSRSSAAIGDFTTNLGRCGFHVVLRHSAVEGAHAIHELTSALVQMNALATSGKIDVLVIVRGGGSLESLQAFNNEAFVRSLAAFSVPVIAGIGHDRDETLTTLVADSGQSTPTGAAKVIGSAWEDARLHVERAGRVMVNSYGESLHERHLQLHDMPHRLTEYFRVLFERFAHAQRRLIQHVQTCGDGLRAYRNRIAQSAQRMMQVQNSDIANVRNHIMQSEKLLKIYDPAHQLAQGYAIVRSGDSVVRRVNDVCNGEQLSVQVSDGIIDAEVKK